MLQYTYYSSCSGSSSGSSRVSAADLKLGQEFEEGIGEGTLRELRRQCQH